MGREDHIADFVLELADCALISCSEPIDRTAAGRLLHGMLASVNEYHSRNMSDEIKRKMLIKVKEGGTPGNCRLGYKNVGEGSKRWVEVDPEPAELIRWCYATYATGEWSTKRLLAEATARGLLTRGGPNTPRKPLSVSQLHRILTSPYYKGIVVFNGVHYQGKHEPLVDDETWQAVQDVMASNANGEKVRVHHHYLKGTIYCGRCGSRLCVSYSKGRRGGIYPYYFCVGRQQKRTVCMLSARPIEVVEDQLIEHYRQVQLTSETLAKTAAAVVAELMDQQTSSEQQRAHFEKRLQQLEAERLKLLQAHYADAIPLDLMKKEQQRISDELASAQSALQVASATVESLKAHADEAVVLATDCYTAYRDASDKQRRLMNQAFFKKVWVTEDGVVGWEYNEPFATLLRAHGAPEFHLIVEHQPDARTEAEENFTPETPDATYYRRSPGRWARAFLCPVSKTDQLAEGAGFEPAQGFP
jgi:site-specific DNA recombinase